MSKTKSSASDELLNQKIQRIKEQNEKIKLRHLEVEEDKKNAIIQDAMVIVGSSGHVSTSRHNAQSYSRRDPDKCDKRRAAREEPSRHGQEHSVRDRNRKTGISRGRGIRERDDVWMKERERIDRERLDRQKTADGQWCREWDTEKDSKEQVHNSAGGRRPAGARFTPGPPLYVKPASPRVKSRVVEVPNYREQARGRRDTETQRFVVTSDTFYGGRPTSTSNVCHSGNDSRHVFLQGLSKYDINESTSRTDISPKETVQPSSNGYLSAEMDSDDSWEDDLSSEEALTDKTARMNNIKIEVDLGPNKRDAVPVVKYN